MKASLIVLAVALGVVAAQAEVQVMNRGGCCRSNGDWIRVSYPHVPLSDPNDPFHDTYKRNTGRLNDQAAKPVANAHAKQSAAENRAIELERRRAGATQSGVKVYSNIREQPRASAPAVAPVAPAQPQTINIYNSNVTIGR